MLLGKQNKKGDQNMMLIIFRERIMHSKLIILVGSSKMPSLNWR